MKNRRVEFNCAYNVVNSKLHIHDYWLFSISSNIIVSYVHLYNNAQWSLSNSSQHSRRTFKFWVVSNFSQNTTSFPGLFRAFWYYIDNIRSDIINLRKQEKKFWDRGWSKYIKSYPILPEEIVQDNCVFPILFYKDLFDIWSTYSQILMETKH